MVLFAAFHEIVSTTMEVMSPLLRLTGVPAWVVQLNINTSEFTALCSLLSSFLVLQQTVGGEESVVYVISELWGKRGPSSLDLAFWVCWSDPTPGHSAPVHH